MRAKQASLRERAQKIQAEDPLEDNGGKPLELAKTQEETGRLSGEAQQLETRFAEVQAALQQADGAGPQNMEAEAAALEEEARNMSSQRDTLRAELHGIEAGRPQARDTWQSLNCSNQVIGRLSLLVPPGHADTGSWIPASCRESATHHRGKCLPILTVCRRTASRRGACSKL